MTQLVPSADTSMKRRQHYVWQHYLRAWATGSQVQCYRTAAGIFPTSTTNVAVERDFYRLSELTPADVTLVRRLAIDNHPPGLLRSLLTGWIPVFTEVFAMRDRFTDLGIDVRSGRAQQQLEVFINDTEENLHARIEETAQTVLDDLRRGDIGVLSSDEALGTFLHFLCVQYVRTKKMREKVRGILRSISNGSSSETASGLLSHVLATTMSFTLASKRDELTWTLLRAPANVRFITTDQPAINLAAVSTPPGKFPEHFDLFYPLSPEWALLLEALRDKHSIAVLDVSAEEVTHYNTIIFPQRHAMAFAQRSEDLEALLSPREV